MLIFDAKSSRKIVLSSQTNNTLLMTQANILKTISSMKDIVMERCQKRIEEAKIHEHRDCENNDTHSLSSILKRKHGI